MNNENIIYAIKCHEDDLAELWSILEIIKYMTKAKPFNGTDIECVCNLAMDAIEHRSSVLSNTKAFWQMPEEKEKE